MRRAARVLKWVGIVYLGLALFYAYTQNIHAPTWLKHVGDTLYRFTDF